MQFILETLCEVGEAWLWLGLIGFMYLADKCSVHHKGE